jgi:DNA-binding transcriptional LysR family regulator
MLVFANFGSSGSIMKIDERKFLGTNLNLLLVFMVVYRERSLSKAAECLRVQQPAISGSLMRLREKFEDRLFLSAGQKGVRPTAKAEKIAELLSPAMDAIQDVFDGKLP